ncbi:hypothetical protein ASE16_09260 [Leifsonia sp. Root227]|uniref:DUF4190 domain-containing protein n=1 Tax=unclassified Leifsonia TaxID=2663824 RepID=UPI0006FEC615|nr:DUF4190 domain-containing protein [Leifsonia sp. Root227]KRC51108.1 hypothetical protein ASE16_09260 [Leifsonia sp. Root227]
MSDSDLNPQPLPPQQQPQYQQPYQGAPAARGYNTMAIVAFILAFFVNIVGIILGFVALSQIKKTGEQGRGLAIAAVIIGFAEIVIGIIFTIAIVAIIAANPSTYTY